MRLATAAAVLAAVLAAPAAGAPTLPVTFASAGRAALSTLLTTWYTGSGTWNECDTPGCGKEDTDWGADSLTYALWLRWSTAGDASIPPVLAALGSNAPAYPGPCTLPGCQSWSDQPEWDAIADAREYDATKDPAMLAKAEAAFQFVDGADAYSLGACPDIPYQQPGGGSNDLKTLESGANLLKAALLLYQATGEHAYLDSATTWYSAIRAHFLDPDVPLYTVYVFDDGTTCTQLPHRFFASVNGDMIWSGLELAQITGTRLYLDQALASAHAVATDLSDPAGIFADLQAENDVVEPLVEAMYDLAVAGQQFARAWILRNAAAALSARAPDGSYGRFFDGPAPVTTVTAWQTNGGLSLEIAAAALDPSGSAAPDAWTAARRVARQLGPTGSIRFRGSAIALLGTLGESCCEAGHARVFVDGRETFDQTGIWQDKSSSGLSIPGTVLFAWRWPQSGVHTISFAPGIANGKEGGSFLHIRIYLVRA
jgi:N-acylglucosamine 2-epimerase (GlcNAc 2-epimerase)